MFEKKSELLLENSARAQELLQKNTSTLQNHSVDKDQQT